MLLCSNQLNSYFLGTYFLQGIMLAEVKVFGEARFLELRSKKKKNKSDVRMALCYFSLIETVITQLKKIGRFRNIYFFNMSINFLLEIPNNHDYNILKLKAWSLAFRTKDKRFVDIDSVKAQTPAKCRVPCSVLNNFLKCGRTRTHCKYLWYFITCSVWPIHNLMLLTRMLVTYFVHLQAFLCSWWYSLSWQLTAVGYCVNTISFSVIRILKRSRDLIRWLH